MTTEIEFDNGQRVLFPFAGNEYEGTVTDIGRKLRGWVFVRSDEKLEGAWGRLHAVRANKVKPVPEGEGESGS